MGQSDRRRTLRVLDLTALVVGYGLAALLFRAIWRSSAGVPTGVVTALVYLWFGLAMSGPILLLLDRRAVPSRPARAPRRRIRDPEALFVPVAGPGPPTYTRAEQGWIMMGAYCIVLTLLAVPLRLGDTPLGVIAVAQLVTALLLWAAGPRRAVAEGPGPSWTHHVAVAVLATWPFAWIGMVLLARS
ncbi:MAG TPA: hypothetical protein VG406_15345 [Isosphaeraceae bacterium]|jgi:hypothetical protein|nr:hypothetical protein [Isosphaeraceae bacterium]